MIITKYAYDHFVEKITLFRENEPEVIEQYRVTFVVYNIKNNKKEERDKDRSKFQMDSNDDGEGLYDYNSHVKKLRILQGIVIFIDIIIVTQSNAETGDENNIIAD